ncbi:hypothetical protein [Motilibacter peucedani]|uniref:hypothetical protein n=1 Tax=Motilibacter peucedani TaxID=598650 RepID=UPI001601179C|nr:hypothetical protein [Motilibacter peucedani]
MSKAAGSAFDAAAQRIADGFAKATQFALTFWTDVDLPTVSKSSGPVHDLQASTHWYTVALAVLCIMVAGLRMAYSGDHRHGYQAVRGTLTWVLTAGAGVAAINALGTASDKFSSYILDNAAGGHLGERIALMAGITSAAGGPNGMGPGLVMLVGFVGILASLVQMMLMLTRVGMLTIVAGVLPLAAAGSGTESGKAWFNRLVSWTVAYLLYKPAAAIVYAAAFFMIGDGSTTFQVLVGMFMMMLSILALPALMRLVTPAVAAATSHGGGGALAAAGMAAVTGARMLADHKSSSSSSTSKTGSHQPGLVGTGSPTGAGHAGSPTVMTASQGKNGSFNVTDLGGKAGSAGAGARAGASGAAKAGAGAATAGAATAADYGMQAASAVRNTASGATNSSVDLGV